MLLLILILILMYLIYRKYNVKEHLNEHLKEHLNEHVTFLTKEELIDYLIKDSDNYYKKFTKLDMQVRNINSIEDYYNNIRESCIDIINNYRSKLINYIKIADDRLSKINLPGFDGLKCSKIKWKIGMVKENKYEGGFPHTRNDLIILNPYISVNLLIHEKVHIYQKMYPEDIKIYLKENGFTKYYELINRENHRANPDLDNWIYKQNNKILETRYKDNPQSISDVINQDSSFEHPFEYMAYYIEKL
jgi:hypothetical protein